MRWMGRGTYNSMMRIDMQIIYGGQQCGKTTRLVEMMRRNQGYKLLTFSKERKRHLVRQYPDLEGRIFVYWEEHYSEDGYVMDDIDKIIQREYGNKLKAVTFTPVWEKPIKLEVPEAIKKQYGADWEI